MDKAFVVQKVANKVWAAENTVDAAMADAASLMVELASARQELKFSADLTEKATADLVNAIASLGQARAALVEMHEELAEVKLRLGVRTKLIGGWDKHNASVQEDLRKTA
jgi:hypothetical protein